MTSVETLPLDPPATQYAWPSAPNAGDDRRSDWSAESDRDAAVCGGRDGIVRFASPLPWPRRPLFGFGLLCGLATVYALSLVPAAGRLEPRVLGIAGLLTMLVRACVAIPLARASGSKSRDTATSAVLAASVAALAGWIAVEALGWAHHPLTLLGRWGGATLLLLAAGPMRRIEVACGTGGRVYFVGTSTQLQELQAEVAERPYLSIVGSRDCSPTPPWGEEFAREVRGSDATVLVLSDDAIRSPAVVEAAARVNLTGTRVRDLRSFYEQQFEKVAVSDLTLSWFLFDISAIHRRRAYGLAKRLLEALVASVALLVVAPLLPVVTLAIKIASPGPVLFRQQRLGRDGKAFTLAKFRTMHRAGADEHGHWADAGAARIFPVGRILRRLRLDELPQLLAVVRGDLSLVGPRPEQPQIAERLRSVMRYYDARHAVRPGLTGWAQVNLGYAGCEAGARAKLQHDLFYIKHQSLALDVRIMASTARAILFGSGS